MFQLQENNRSLYLVALAIFLSRIPFLFSGFGSEEDAYGLILTARNISLTGLYEVSRMPGHPLQELLLAMLWELPPWVLNLMTATVSTTGVLFFMFTLRLWNIRSVIPSGVAFAAIAMSSCHQGDSRLLVRMIISRLPKPFAATVSATG